MLNSIYRLVSPRRIVKSVIPMELNSMDNVIVRPLYLSICRADQRYYMGNRDKRVLDSKLPMALIHEGVAEVVFDYSNKFSVGTRVAMIPIHPHDYLSTTVPDNYSEKATFSSSSEDGFLSEYISISPERLIALDKDFPLEKAVYLEALSVAVQAVERMKISATSKNDIIGVWGDGNVSYMIALVLKYTFNSKRIVVFGKHSDKLAYFNFVETILIDEIPKSLRVDQAIEAVGGIGSGHALDQIMDNINVMGTIVLAGVTENSIPVKTRIILEKGLALVGTTRSSKRDFERAYALLKNEDVQSSVDLLTQKKLIVRNETELIDAFDQDMNLSWGKTIIDWRV